MGSAATSAWVPPDQFDEYRLVQALGRGGMGQVFLAHDTLLDRAVAVKFIAAVHRTEVARQRFLIEARAAARLSHPNVIHVHRVGELDGRPYLVSEFVRGQSLDKVARPVAAPQLLAIAIGLARGLAAAHRRGVLHRDIKPANAMLAESGEVKLLDFGLAKLFEGEAVPGMAEVRASGRAPSPLRPAAIDADGDTHAPAPVDPDATHSTPREAPHARVVALDDTVTPIEAVPLPAGVRPASHATTPPPDAPPGVTIEGALMGTPAYMSPEAWLGDPATPRSDVYSMGVVLYELCAGRSPHRADSMGQLREAITERDPVPLAERVPGVDARFAAIVERCLARDPAARFASAEELRDALERLTAAPTDSTRARGNPYRGLAAFEAEHADVFFGRDGAIRAVVDRLRSDGFVLVAGDSGVGKSSLCRAGVVPRAAAGALDRPFTSVSVLPGPHPVLALAAALAPVLDDDEPAVATALLDDPAALVRRLRYRLGAARGLLIVVDQLEELITQAEPIEAAAAAAFIAALAPRCPQLRLLATVRGDFLTRLASLPALASELERAIYVLAPLSPDAIREVIVDPAAATGVRFESTALVDELVRATAATDGGLPLLQFALADLWDARDKAAQTITAASLEAIGGVAGALARHADATIAAMLPDARAAARTILLALVTDADTRARRREDDLLGGRPEARVALDALTRARLLLARGDAGETVYELAHDSLIVTWPALQAWLRVDAGDRVARDQLSRAAADWDRQGRPRDLLWAARRLDTLAAIAPDALSTVDRAFVVASRRAHRRRRLAIAGAIAIAPIVAGAVYVGTQLADARALERRIDGELAEARRVFDARAPLEAALDEARAEAFARFDADDYAGGEAAWRRVVAADDALDKTLARAGQIAERASSRDSGRRDARALLGDVLFARALLAESRHDARVVEDLLDRIALYAPDRAADWHRPGSVEITPVPASATIALERWDEPDDAAGAWRAIATPEGTDPLAPGSYRAIVSGDGHATTIAPFVLARGEHRRVDVRLPIAAAVPPGFVAIAPTELRFGNADPDEIRTAVMAAPLHLRRTSSTTLVSARETTFGEWIAFLDALPADEAERRRPTAAGNMDDAQIALERDGAGAWTLTGTDGADDWRSLPVTGVSADDAAAYAAWLATTGRVARAHLCSEVEWELAARGADGRRYPTGDTLPVAAANTQEGHAGGEPRVDVVGLRPTGVSPTGVLDAAGNVWEITSASAGDGMTIARGGAFAVNRAAARSDVREVIETSLRDRALGLRVCATLD